MTLNENQNWIWTDCNKWDGLMMSNQYNQSISFDANGTEISGIAKI